ncbi:MAG: TetR family transcriptional regulator [Desulfobulbaceae bacterium]|nr:TetR family transcriptional regulator [Desulfobulbaceae bacterium]
MKETKERILDSAENLFAESGYQATSLRAITQKAEVNLASVNYHFGSKEGLVDEVIRRRLVPLNKLRMQQLQNVFDHASSQKSNPNAEDILRAFIEPTITFLSSSNSLRHFTLLIGRSFAEPDDTVRKIFFSLMEPIFNTMMKGLKLALPNITEEVLFWRLHFSLGATSHTLRCIDNCPMTQLFNGKDPATDAESLIGLLLPFVTAGMEAPQ